MKIKQQCFLGKHELNLSFYLVPIMENAKQTSMNLICYKVSCEIN